MRTPPSSGPAARTAASTPRAVSYVSTRSVVPTPRAATWARNASSSESWSSTQAWAAVPIVGTPHSRPASRLLVAANPAIYAARAAATALFSWARRDPISESGLFCAAMLMRAAAEATAES